MTKTNISTFSDPGLLVLLGVCGLQRPVEPGLLLPRNRGALLGVLLRRHERQVLLHQGDQTSQRSRLLCVLLQADLRIMDDGERFVVRVLCSVLVLYLYNNLLNVL